jgi:hypothetical protein
LEAGLTLETLRTSRTEIREEDQTREIRIWERERNAMTTVQLLLQLRFLLEVLTIVFLRTTSENISKSSSVQSRQLR